MALTPEEQIQLDTLLAKQKAGKKTLVVFKVLDASTSMARFAESTCSTYNESVDALNGIEGDVYVTTIEFGSRAQVARRSKLADVPALSAENYNPRGNTALYDAIGLAFEEADKLEKEPNTAFLLEILTDGEENCSERWNAERLRSEISRRKESGWTVTVMGPKGSVDIFANIGISIGNIAQYDVSSVRSRKGVSRLMASSAASYTRSFNSSSDVATFASASTYSDAVGVAGAADVDTWLDAQDAQDAK